MIEKELVTTQTEVWRDPHQTHRYVFKRQWAIKGKEAEEKLAVVITIRPTDTEPFTNDLSMLLIEKNIRQLGFTGFVAVNLFRIQKRKVLGYFLVAMMNNLWKY